MQRMYQFYHAKHAVTGFKKLTHAKFDTMTKKGATEHLLKQPKVQTDENILHNRPLIWAK